MSEIIMHGTTIVSVRHQNRVVMAGDGQVSLGNAVVKPTVAGQDFGRFCREYC